jgi:hypothetical protein
LIPSPALEAGHVEPRSTSKMMTVVGSDPT